jgi:hypothetical protein
MGLVLVWIYQGLCHTRHPQDLKALRFQYQKNSMTHLFVALRREIKCLVLEHMTRSRRKPRHTKQSWAILLEVSTLTKAKALPDLGISRPPIGILVLEHIDLKGMRKATLALKVRLVLDLERA